METIKHFNVTVIILQFGIIIIFSKNVLKLRTLEKDYKIGLESSWSCATITTKH